MWQKSQHQRLSSYIHSTWKYSSKIDIISLWHSSFYKGSTSHRMESRAFLLKEGKFNISKLQNLSYGNEWRWSTQEKVVIKKFINFSYLDIRITGIFLLIRENVKPCKQTISMFHPLNTCIKHKHQLQKRFTKTKFEEEKKNTIGIGELVTYYKFK